MAIVTESQPRKAIPWLKRLYTYISPAKLERMPTTRFISSRHRLDTLHRRSRYIRPTFPTSLGDASLVKSALRSRSDSLSLMQDEMLSEPLAPSLGEIHLETYARKMCCGFFLTLF
ncbi:hypothetical protein AG1IA_03639 [Rhizoctonia solani AG-1 IA]|uniref:Uncharacterized protein n=1 Tax=Thanatephorus cucumeris (strain AG1-IA) TaxID=983506 RepID=L8X155_THACA|nr:hypothetical protein AG1IA_03639 [Rhizoctonia solani AG-1 IA]